MKWKGRRQSENLEDRRDEELTAKGAMRYPYETGGAHHMNKMPPGEKFPEWIDGEFSHTHKVTEYKTKNVTPKKKGTIKANAGASVNPDRKRKKD